jgi:hypothetical protein
MTHAHAHALLTKRQELQARATTSFQRLEASYETRAVKRACRAIRSWLRFGLPSILAVCLPATPLSFSYPSAPADGLRTG